MNPVTDARWVIDEAGRRALARALRVNSNTRQWHAPSLIAQIDAVARDYQRLAFMRQQIADDRGPDLERLKARGGLRAELLAHHRTIKLGKGRPRLTRERHAVVFALARVWPCRIRLSPRSPFVVALRIVLQAAEGVERPDAYSIARRVASTPLPPVSERLEPCVVSDLLAP